MADERAVEIWTATVRVSVDRSLAALERKDYKAVAENLDTAVASANLLSMAASAWQKERP